MRYLPILMLISAMAAGQTPNSNFYFGADLSYVDEMEDCGEIYRENGSGKDPYRIFADHGCNLVRLRLWHTPSFYDTLNVGKRYSDLVDVRNSMQRAKSLGMNVLLDFHLSDFWADPGRQLCPVAWLGVVNNLPVLKDSLYRYVRQTLLDLDADDLLPEIVQIGNETNRGILLSPAVNNAGWSLDWSRNSQLFNAAIQAVRDVETQTGKSVKVALHIAGPAEAGWLMQGFWNNGVRDFDIIGLSYYWAYHKPTTIQNTGSIITQLQQQYPGKSVMILETGYIWTTQNADNANNIMNLVHPDYSPASPANQLKWMIDLAREVMNKGGIGVVYWEPAWVSSACRTPWGQGSHQENATFFDFQNNLQTSGGIGWMSYDYNLQTGTETPVLTPEIRVQTDSGGRKLTVEITGLPDQKAYAVAVLDQRGQAVLRQHLTPDGEGKVTAKIDLPVMDTGVYFALLYRETDVLANQGFFLSQQ